MKVIPIRLDDSVVEQIDAVATRQQRTRSALIKIWINDNLKKEVYVDDKEQQREEGTVN